MPNIVRRTLAETAALAEMVHPAGLDTPGRDSAPGSLVLDLFVLHARKVPGTIINLLVHATYHSTFSLRMDHISLLNETKLSDY
jgi:hypothetical protein